LRACRSPANNYQEKKNIMNEIAVLLSFDTNVLELADLLDATYYVLGNSGRDAISAMMADIAEVFSSTIAEKDIEWLTNADGTQSTLADVTLAIAVLAERYASSNLLDEVIL